MVQINTLFLAGLAAVGAVARPANSRRQQPGCMTPEQAQFVATNFGTLIANYSDALANQVLAENFTDYSESVNTLINTCPQGDAAISLPLLSPTFMSRQMFETGQAQQPPINFQQLSIFPGCDSVVIRWMTNNTAPIPNPKPVVGLIAMEVVPNPNATAAVNYPFLIDYVYSEFDAGAWLQNLQEAGICGPAPGPCDSQQVPQEASTSTAGAAAPTSSSAAGSTSTGAASAPSSGAGGAGAYAPSASYSSPSTSTASVPVVTVTTTVNVVVNPDGTVSEEPCEE